MLSKRRVTYEGSDVRHGFVEERVSLFGVVGWNERCKVEFVYINLCDIIADIDGIIIGFYLALSKTIIMPALDPPGQLQLAFQIHCLILTCSK